MKKNLWYSTVCYGLMIGGCALIFGCSQSQIAQGQLFCAKIVAGEPMVVALADLSGAPVLAVGATKAFVDTACDQIDAIPVAPPASPAAAPVVVVTPPAV